MKRIFTALSVLGVLLVGVFIFIKFFNKTDQPPTLKTINEEDFFEDLPEVDSAQVKKVDESTSTFIHKGYGFTLNYPSSMEATNFREGGGEQILFQDDSKSLWFQMYVTVWDEEGDLTVARIKKDMPSLVIDSPQTVVLGPHQKEGVGPRAVIFFSRDSGLGDTREVWFTYEGYLYQITTYKRLDSEIGKILTTLSFE